MQEQIEAVQRMQEYIEEHLREEISFADVEKYRCFLHGMQGGYF